MNLAKPVYDDLGITEKKEKSYKFVFKNNLDQSPDITPNNLSPHRAFNDQSDNCQDNIDEIFKNNNSIYNNRQVNQRKYLNIDINDISDEEDRLNREM